jgi:hypothetical protein
MMPVNVSPQMRFVVQAAIKRFTQNSAVALSYSPLGRFEYFSNKAFWLLSVEVS